MRLFFAIDLPDEVKGHLASVQRQWEGHCLQWRTDFPIDRVSFTKRPNLHITMKFLGEVDDATLGRLLSTLKQLQPVGPFQLRTDSVQYFPPRGPIRVVAINLDGDVGRLNQIYDQLEDLCEQEGFRRESRSFHPHITIARSCFGIVHSWTAGGRDKPVISLSPPFLVDHVTLYESRLKPTGPEYVKLASFPL